MRPPRLVLSCLLKDSRSVPAVDVDSEPRSFSPVSAMLEDTEEEEEEAELLLPSLLDLGALGAEPDLCCWGDALEAVTD